MLNKKTVCVGCIFLGGALFHSRPDPFVRNNKSCQGTGIPGSHGMEGKSPEALQTWSSFQMVKATLSNWKAKLYCSTVSPYKPKSWDKSITLHKPNVIVDHCSRGRCDVTKGYVFTQTIPTASHTQPLSPWFQLSSWQPARFHGDDSSYPVSEVWQHDPLTTFKGNSLICSEKIRKSICQVQGSNRSTHIIAFPPQRPQSHPTLRCRFFVSRWLGSEARPPAMQKYLGRKTPPQTTHLFELVRNHPQFCQYELEICGSQDLIFFLLIFFSPFDKLGISGDTKKNGFAPS